MEIGFVSGSLQCLHDFEQLVSRKNIDVGGLRRFLEHIEPGFVVGGEGTRQSKVFNVFHTTT